jgi:hypothetical protein
MIAATGEDGAKGAETLEDAFQNPMVEAPRGLVASRIRTEMACHDGGGVRQEVSAPSRARTQVKCKEIVRVRKREIEMDLLKCPDGEEVHWVPGFDLQADGEAR